MKTNPNGEYHGYVYLAIASGKYRPTPNVYKIGCTKRHPTKRFPCKGGEGAYYHTLIDFCVAENMHILEKGLHEIFYAQRVERKRDAEYFLLSVENIAFITDIFDKAMESFYKKFNVVPIVVK